MKRISQFFLLASFTISCGFAQIITTLAGTGTAGFSGDGGPATQAQLNQVNYLGVDGAGNIYLQDAGNNRIRKVSTAGAITTVVGNGTPEGPDALQLCKVVGKRFEFPPGAGEERVEIHAFDHRQVLQHRFPLRSWTGRNAETAVAHYRGGDAQGW